VPIAMLIAYGMGTIIERAGTLSPTQRVVAGVMAAIAKRD